MGFLRAFTEHDNVILQETTIIAWGQIARYVNQTMLEPGY